MKHTFCYVLLEGSLCFWAYSLFDVTYSTNKNTNENKEQNFKIFKNRGSLYPGTGSLCESLSQARLTTDLDWSTISKHYGTQSYAVLVKQVMSMCNTRHNHWLHLLNGDQYNLNCSYSSSTIYSQFTGSMFG